MYKVTNGNKKKRGIRQDISPKGKIKAEGEREVQIYEQEPTGLDDCRKRKESSGYVTITIINKYLNNCMVIIIIENECMAKCKNRLQTSAANNYILARCF